MHLGAGSHLRLWFLRSCFTVIVKRQLENIIVVHDKMGCEALLQIGGQLLVVCVVGLWEDDLQQERSGACVCGAGPSPSTLCIVQSRRHNFHQLSSSRVLL